MPTSPKPKASSYSHILRECADIADEREAQYGEIRKNFESISAVAKAMFGLDISPLVIIKVMIATKFARHLHRPKKDNLSDAINYTAILSKFEEDDAKTVLQATEHIRPFVGPLFTALPSRAQKDSLLRRRPRKNARRRRSSQ